MDAEDRRGLEVELRLRFDAGDLHGCATAAIHGYGPELFGYLVGLTRDHDAAADVFGGACEKLWRGLPRFRWDSSLRVWAFAIARHHFLHWIRDRKRNRREVALSDAPAVSAAIAAVRTSTAAHQRTDVKDGFAALRATLEPDDQLLLGLRLDGNRAWDDIARVLAAEGAPAPTARDVAALRKRFERLKKKLRALAEEGGLGK
jgi:RNA polymerase sigma-70 factor, ECF subfamily